MIVILKNLMIVPLMVLILQVVFKNKSLVKQAVMSLLIVLCFSVFGDAVLLEDPSLEFLLLKTIGVVLGFFIVLIGAQYLNPKKSQ